MRAFYLLYVTIYERATLFDYFFQFLTVPPIYFKSPSVPFYIATNEVLRGAARWRVGGRLVAPQTLPRLPAQWRECSTQFSREEAWFWTRTSNLTRPPKGHMTSACWSLTGCLVGYMMSRGLFRKQTLELYSSAEACHNVAVHPYRKFVTAQLPPQGGCVSLLKWRWEVLAASAAAFWLKHYGGREEEQQTVVFYSRTAGK